MTTKRAASQQPVYYVYGREKGKHRFRLMDLGRGCFVSNRIHATRLEAARVSACLARLESENTEFEFEARRVNGGTL